MGSNLNNTIASENAARASADNALAKRISIIEATVTPLPPVQQKPLAKVLGAVKSVPGNPAVQSALTALLVKALAKKRG